jgi:hypothetical protein
MTRQSCAGSGGVSLMPMDSRALVARFRRLFHTGWRPPRHIRPDLASSTPNGSAIRMGAIFWQHNSHAHLGGALHHGVKVVHFEPEQDAVSIGLVIAVANPPMVVFHFEAVQLKDQLAI